ncbi:unnamed protein product, partial [Bubo scandiacus]
MGGSLSEEEGMILTMWKLLLQRRGVKVDDAVLRKMLLWSKEQGYEASTVTAFSVSKWEELGQKLLENASQGNKNATDLLTTWRLLKETLKDFKVEKESSGETSYNPGASTVWVSAEKGQDMVLVGEARPRRRPRLRARGLYEDSDEEAQDELFPPRRPNEQKAPQAAPPLPPVVEPSTPPLPQNAPPPSDEENEKNP